MKKHYYLLLSFWVTLFACEKPEKEVSYPFTPAPYGDNVFIVHEGAFGSGKSSISLYNKSTKVNTNDVFFNANAIDLGDVAQSMTSANGKGYVVVNKSGKVEVVSLPDLKLIHTIAGFESPRYFLQVSANIAYVSDWVENNIKIIDLSSNAIIGHIATGVGPEQMVKVGDKVFVCNLGGFGLDETVTIINSASHSVINTIKVGEGPVAAKVDKNNSVWILCRGAFGDYSDPTDDLPGKLVKLNSETNLVELSMILTQGNHPDRLAINKDKDMLYYCGIDFPGIYQHPVSSNIITTNSFINIPFYGFDLDPSNDEIYAADAKNFSLKGDVFRFSPTGLPIDTFGVDVIPSSFFFY